MRDKHPGSPEVLVVGAGPVGLCLALALARAGRRVVVLEKEAATAEHSRAPAIWPRTLEVLAGLGVVERFLEEGIVVPEVELRDMDHDRVILAAPLSELAGRTPYPHLLVLPQSRTEALLLDAVRRQPTAEVRFSHEVTRLVPGPSGVEVGFAGPDGDETVSALFVAGCDGAHSFVRHALGAAFDGETYRVRAALSDVEVETPRLSFPRLTSRPRPAVGIRMGERLWRLILPFAAGDGVSLEERTRDAVASLLPGESWTPVWSSEFRLHDRIASTFALGRVALAGDAAHLNSPVGGQGMNAGIQDTEVLAPALLEALDTGSPAPLAHYSSRRRPQVRQGVNRFTDRLTDLLLAANGLLFRPTLRLAGLAMHVPPLRRRMLKNIAMLD